MWFKWSQTCIFKVLNQKLTNISLHSFKEENIFKPFFFTKTASKKGLSFGVNGVLDKVVPYLCASYILQNPKLVPPFLGVALTERHRLNTSIISDVMLLQGQCLIE